MGADENAAIMRRAYEAFNSGDMNTLNELFDESAVWHLPGPGQKAMANATTRAARRPSPTWAG